jgi:hypothetical protein
MLSAGVLVSGYELFGGLGPADDGTEGDFTQTGGTHTIGTPTANGTLQLGSMGGTGTYYLSDGSVVVNGVVLVGADGPGVLTISGGSMNVTGLMKVWNSATATVSFSGGALSVGTLDTSGDPTRFGWTAGALSFTGPSGLDIGTAGPLGSNIALNGAQTLQVAGTTSLDASSHLTLSGGVFSTGTFSGSGSLTFNTGTLQVNSSNVSLGPGTPLGNSRFLGIGANLVVAGPDTATIVPSGALLFLNGGSVFNSASGFLEIDAGGQVTMFSALSSVNGGLLFNSGTLLGTGQINAPLSNSGGVVSVASTDTLIFQGSGNDNNAAGRITLGGGTIQFTQDLLNDGTISGNGSLLVGQLSNRGTISGVSNLSCSTFDNLGTAIFSGASNVFGTVVNFSGINITSGSTTFHGDVDTNTGSISVGTNSTAVFLGAVTGQTQFSGAGLKDFEGVVNGGAIASIVGDTNVGTSSIVTTDYFNEDDLQIGGVATVRPNGTSAAASRVHSLEFLGSGKLDLNDNDLIVDYTGASPLTTIRADILTGRHGGDWLGNALTSTFAHNTSLTAHPTALGYAEASALGLSTFDGQAVDITSIIVRYTYIGDANLDGVVNALDFNAVATNFGAGTSEFWYQGDFNFDGIVNTQDFTQLAGNFGQLLPSPAFGSVVPEPGVMCACAAIWLVGSHRRRARIKKHTNSILCLTPRATARL